MQMLNMMKSTRSKMKTTLPMVSRPVNLFGVFPRTTANDPVDIVHANHGLWYRELVIRMSSARVRTM
jgi:hypothetical protein